jgi:hypothetical protein
MEGLINGTGPIQKRYYFKEQYALKVILLGSAALD